MRKLTQISYIDHAALIGFLGLMAVSLLFFLGFERFYQVGINQVRNGNFDAGVSNWAFRGKLSLQDDHLTLSNASNKETSFLRQRIQLPQQTSFLLASVTLSTQGVRPGELPGERIRLYLVGNDGNGILMWRSPHLIVEVGEDIAPTVFSKVIQVPENASFMEVGVDIYRSVGLVSISNVSVVPVVEKTSFKFINAVLASCWVLLILGPVRKWIKSTFVSLPKTLIVLIAVYGALSFILLIVPGPQLSSAIQISLEAFDIGVVLSVSSITTQALSYLGGDEVAHFLIYFPLACVTYFLPSQSPRSSQNLWLVLLVATVFTMEFFQMFTFGREIEFSDIAFGLLGVMVGGLTGLSAKYFIGNSK